SSPPAWGRTPARAPYAIAPANGGAPPAIHAARNHTGSGTLAATCGGVNRMPPPITFETMIAAASNGPNRRASDARPLDIKGRRDYRTSPDQMSSGILFGGRRSCVEEREEDRPAFIGPRPLV